MDDDIRPFFDVKTHGFHHAVARCGTVPRMDIYMFAIEAGGAVVRITIARHRRSTVFADKIFYGPNKHRILSQVERVSVYYSRHRLL